MDGFRFLAARSPEEAVAHYYGHDEAMYVAGGTDLLPNVKHRIFRPRHIVGLAGALPRGWSVRDGEVERKRAEAVARHDGMPDDPDGSPAIQRTL
jgi:CO/xanthine dehydrogenase FAD-binding subunit